MAEHRPLTTQECRCDADALRRGFADAVCPVHGVMAFIRSLPNDPDDRVEDLPPIGDGFDEI